jgi:16S rRNA (uracil1498-N3)-methyltransferase
LNLFYQPLLGEGAHYLDPDESKHAIRVLRHRVGDVIHITDGKGNLHEGRILAEDQTRCTFEVVSSVREAQPDHSIHLAISPLSHPDRLEWFIEKAVELGVSQITLIACERTDKRQVKPGRLHKIAVGAMKQSQRFTLPVIQGPIPFDSFVPSCREHQKFIAYVDADNPRHLFAQAKKKQAYVICIGPEGDFSAKELNFAMQHDFIKVSLGTHRLRTETAGIAACHILDLVNLG